MKNYSAHGSFLVGAAARFSPSALVGAILAVTLWCYLPAGIYLGGDWTLPATSYQAQQFYYPYVWSGAYNFGMPWLLAAIGLPYGLFVHFITALGLPVEYLGKTVLTLVIMLGYFFLYRLLRYFKLCEASATIGGLTYITTPIFFNYALMGWQFVLLAMALFPIAVQWFCQAVRQDDIRYSIGVALIWAIAVLQSQSLVWFPMLFLVLGVFLIRDQASTQAFLKKLGVIFIVFIGISSYWWIGIILFQDADVTSNAIVMSEVSVGADSHFIALNAMRLWGGLFNFQYESAMRLGWEFDSWILPAVATVAFLASEGQNRKIAIAMGLIAFVLPASLLLLKEHREILMAIPGAGLIRQLSRFTVLTSFAYAVLVGVFLDSLLSVKRFPVRMVLCSAVALFIAATWPWWNGALTNTGASMVPGADFRLRVKEFPRDYYEAEMHLEEIRWISRALYLPYGMNAAYKDDPAYYGAYKEAVDVFAGFSPIPGIFMPSDRPSPISDYIAFLQRTDNMVSATRSTPTNFYVLRNNLDPGVVEPILSDKARYFPETEFHRILDSKNIIIYVRKNLIPMIYSPAKRHLENDVLDVLAEEVRSDVTPHARVSVLASQNFEKRDSVSRFVTTGGIPDAVEYRRINPAKYRIRMHAVRGDIPLVFGESFSHGWRLYPVARRDRHKSLVAPENYAVTSGNERYQADRAEVQKFVERGWITGGAVVGSRTSGFVSKRYHGAIQNDYLPEGAVWETWNSTPIPENSHIKVNGYANGWAINANQLCAMPLACHQNEDGSFDVDLVMEFWPQQIFYLGLALSSLTLFFSVAFLLWANRKTG